MIWLSWWLCCLMPSELCSRRTLVTAKIAKRSNRGSKPGERRGGRKRGTPNKISGTVREMVLEALAEKGGTKWLKQQMDKNPSAFMALLGKILPQQHTGAEGGPLIIRW